MLPHTSDTPVSRLKEFANSPPALSLGSNTGTTRRTMIGMERTKNSMDRAMSILVTPTSLLDKLDDVWLRQRTIWVSLTDVMMVIINTMIGQPYCQQKPVKHAIQSTDHGFIPEIVIVDVRLPGNPLRAHLIETRDLKHGSDSESCKQKNRHAENNYKSYSFCRDTGLSSQGKQDADTSFSCDNHR